MFGGHSSGTRSAVQVRTRTLRLEKLFLGKLKTSLSVRKLIHLNCVGAFVGHQTLFEAWLSLSDWLKCTFELLITAVVSNTPSVKAAKT